MGNRKIGWHGLAQPTTYDFRLCGWCNVTRSAKLFLQSFRILEDAERRGFDPPTAHCRYWRTRKETSI